MGVTSSLSSAPKPPERRPDDNPRSGYNSGYAQFHGGSVRDRRM
eukprot:CAMPEP_0173401240 /NCGR_PEP_ID=MMETSP1356-20130122/50336_1 /TAXON_ID=77927 ORGANISM="Hemiselmis virescens, Strain PCC157" /NCGR_SAMPLE_ID=MMETSP1356 /ASSEMBLY_ACC=CAM_ASM_000847 /LENGTH=43 /DNA_ID= /DNA_START= /DNA_END= /DNA_ORIENTATION=